MKKTLLLSSLFFFLLSTSFSQTWSSIGTGVDNTTGDETAVNAMIEFNGDLYIAGCFTSVNGVTAKYIAKFDGTNWSAVGNGLWHTGNTSTIYSGVKCLAVYNGELYAGGVFNQTGTTALSNIAKWNGTSWVSVGNGFTSSPNTVNALCVYNNELYAAGSLGGGFNSIAKWNGTSWIALGTGMHNSGGGVGLVRDMKVYNNVLYVGGQFANGNGISCQNLIAYNGTNFMSIGPGAAGSYGITKMGLFQASLAVAGGFTDINGTSFKNIAQYNGIISSWSAFGTGIGTAGGNSFETQPLQEYNNKLVAAGFFTTAGSTSVNSIAQWDGITWLAMGSGVNGYVASLISYNNVLYVAGKFTLAGGITVKNIAKWTEPGAAISEISTNKKISAFPNPTSETLTIKVLQDNMSIKKITVLNSLGSDVLHLNNSNTTPIQLNLEKYPSGIYFIRIETESETIIKKVIKN